MANEKNIAAALREAAEKHHEAFASSDGADENWATWYAEYLLRQTDLDLKFNADILSAKLTKLAEQFNGTDWAEKYARNLSA
jgi:hypothetical protein